MIRTVDISKFLNTNKLKTVLPSIPGKYGSNEPLDVMITMNPYIYREGDPDSPINGFQFFKNGTIKRLPSRH